MALTLVLTEWAESKHPHTTAEFRSQLHALSADSTNPNAHECRSLLFPFSSAQIPELNKALDAPVCEFVRLASSTLFVPRPAILIPKLTKFRNRQSSTSFLRRL